MEDFDLLEPVFRNRLVNFDYVGPNVAPSATWVDIVSDLDALSTQPGDVAGLALDLAAWLRPRLAAHDHFSLLGV